MVSIGFLVFGFTMLHKTATADGRKVGLKDAEQSSLANRAGASFKSLEKVLIRFAGVLVCSDFFTQGHIIILSEQIFMIIKHYIKFMKREIYSVI